MSTVHRSRLFLGSCFALISTAICFSVVSGIVGPLKGEFAFSNEEAGYIRGAAIWGFSLSIFALGPLVDALGMKKLLRFAVLCHVAGPLIMILAPRGEASFWVLFAGALISALGNGTVEAVCNPLIATLYPEEKTKKLNQFHVWFPGGIVIGGVAVYLLNTLGANETMTWIGNWRIQVGLIFIPTVIYAILFMGQAVPATERVQSGLSFGDMVRGAVTRPLFIILLICMCVTASLELGPGAWIPAVLTAGGIAGILVLAYINGLMAILRFFAGPVVHKLSPTGILVASAVLSGAGLYWFSFSESVTMAFASATVFAVGVCYFWPTMLGVVSERVPKSGALGLALMGGTGMLMVGLVTGPQMGNIADTYVHDQLDPVATRAVLQQVVDVYPGAAAEQEQVVVDEAAEAVGTATAVLTQPELPEGDTAKALRTAISNNPGGDEADAVVKAIGEVLNPADNHGGRMSFRFVAPFAIIIVVVFGVIYLRDRAAGGYKAEKLEEEPSP